MVDRSAVAGIPRVAEPPRPRPGLGRDELDLAAELIRESEGVRRGSYGGFVGYLRGDGELDTCIVIRSAFVKDGTALVQAGAGVVADSVPEREAAETVHKASAVLHAVAAAQAATLVIDSDTGTDADGATALALSTVAATTESKEA